MTILGLTNEEWTLINSFSNWLSAIGTIAAVVVSLHLARKSGKPSARASVGHRLIVTPGVPGNYPEVLVFRIVNTGDRPIRISQIGWKVGLWNKRYSIQTFDTHQSSSLPVELTHGQEAHWVVPLDASEDPWLGYFAKGMLLPNWRTSCLTLHAQFYTSVGHIFAARPDHGLLKKFRETCIVIAGSGANQSFKARRGYIVSKIIGYVRAALTPR